MKLAWLRSQEGAHDDSVWAATWVPATDESPALLLTGSLDETVKLWNPQDLSLIRTNSGHCLGVVSVAAHPSGKIAASASIDSFVRVFDVESNNTIATLEAPPSEVWQLQFNPQGTTLAVAGGGSASVKLWNTAEWKLVATLSVPRPEGVKSSDKNGSKKVVDSILTRVTLNGHELIQVVIKAWAKEFKESFIGWISSNLGRVCSTKLNTKIDSNPTRVHFNIKQEDQNAKELTLEFVPKLIQMIQARPNQNDAKTTPKQRTKNAAGSSRAAAPSRRAAAPKHAGRTELLHAAASMNHAAAPCPASPLRRGLRRQPPEVRARAPTRPRAQSAPLATQLRGAQKVPDRSFPRSCAEGHAAASSNSAET